MSGPVTFAVTGGPYTEQVVLNPIAGSSATNTVTFDGGGCTLRYGLTTYTQQAIWQFNGADYVTLNNLNVTGMSSTYGRGIFLTDGADYDTVSNCTITLDATSGSAYLAGIVASGSSTSNTGGNTSNYLTLQGNTISGGLYGIYLSGAGTSSLNVGNQLLGNTVRDFGRYGIYFVCQGEGRISGNDLHRATRTGLDDFYGIYLSGNCQHVAIEKNRLHDPCTTAPASSTNFYGIYLTGNHPTAGNENDVVNNVVYNVNGTGLAYALYNNGSDYTRYYHNTVALDAASAPTSYAAYGFFQTGLATGIELKNNVISLTRGSGSLLNKYALFFATPASGIACDYNDLHLGPGSTYYVGYANATSYATLAGWQGAARGYDIHSVAASPGFVALATGNLTPAALALNDVGTPLARVPDDITGAVRGAVPDLGAYEFTPVFNDAAVTGIVNFTPYAAGSRSVVVNVLNNGAATLNTLTLTYVLNGSPAGQQAFGGLGLGAGQAGQLTLTGVALPTGLNTLTVSSSLPNGALDPNPANDTQTLTNRSALSGPYTLNNALPTGGTNFGSFTDAATALNLGGVLSAVSFAVSGGPYTEQLLLTELAGTSASHPVVFNGGGCTLRYTSTTASQRAAVRLDGADYVTLSNLYVDARNGGQLGIDGWGVLLTNAADHNTISGCTIATDVTSRLSGSTPLVVSGTAASLIGPGNAANYLTVQGNTLLGGSYGMTLLGASAASPALGNRIVGNTFRDFFSEGIYALNQREALLSANDLSRPTRQALGNYYGISLRGGCTKVSIEKNRLHDPYTAAVVTTGAFYGIFLTDNDATAGNENYISNNLVYSVVSDGDIYALYNYSSDYARYYHNTVALDATAANTSAGTYGFCQAGLATGIELKNNLIALTRSTGGDKYAVYFATAASGIAADYNDLAVGIGTGTGFYTGGLGATAYPTLASWQAAPGGYDAHSVQAAPNFFNPAAGNFTPSSAGPNNAGTPLSTVPDDITGATRGTVPDLGAYEFTPYSRDVAPVALAGPGAGAGCYGPAEPVIVVVRNNGTTALNLAATPIAITVVVTLPGGGTQTLTGTASTGVLPSGSTQPVTLPGTLSLAALGTYAFALTATVAGDSNPANDVLTPAPSLTVSPPLAGTVAALSLSGANLCQGGQALLQLTGAQNGTIEWQQSPDNVTFTTIAGTTNFLGYTTPYLTATTYYRVLVTCNGNTAFSNAVPILVLTPQVAATNAPVVVCPNTAATLTAQATPGTTLRWYDSATGASPLATGPSFTTPALPASRQYYVEAAVAQVIAVGPASVSLGSASSMLVNFGLIFDVARPTTLFGVYVYPNLAGTATILYQNSAATVLQSATATFTAADLGRRTFVPLNFSLQAGTGFRLVLDPTTTTAWLLYHTNATYPFASPDGNVQLTGQTLNANTTATSYFFFYDWQVGGECASPRTALPVSVLPSAVASFGYPSASYCQSSPSSPAPTLTGVGGGTFTSSGPGLAVNASTGALNLGTATPGTYIITYAVPAIGTGCAGVGAASVTIAPAAPTPTLTATGQGGNVLLTSSAPAGNQFYLNGVPLTGATGQTYLVASGSMSGSYTVTATSAAGCSSAASVAVLVTVTATTTAAPGTRLHLAPNPTTGTLTLTLTNVRQASTLTLLNALGQVVLTRELSAPAVQAPVGLDVTALASGVYLLRVSNSAGVLSQRLVRE